MASTSQDTTRQAYNATVSLKFSNKGKQETIPSENISYIMIEHDYENQVLPIIYISLSVDSNLYGKINKYKESAKFILKIKKTNKNNDNSVGKETISGSFNYIPSSTNPNYSEELNDGNQDNYRRIMIGLVSIDLTNKLRSSYNMICKGIDTNTLVGLALDGTNCIIEKPKYNTNYSTLIIPPITTRYRLLQFTFDQDPFYDTYFRYFMDFKNSYLLSKEGKPIDAGDGSKSSVIIDIRKVTESEAYYDGIQIKNGAYYVYVNPSDSNVTLNQGTEKVANNIIGVDEDKGVNNVELKMNKSEGSTTKSIYVRTEHPSVYKNEMERDSVIVEFTKKHIDGNVFTPNKKISVKNYGDYSKYDGTYIMLYKREFLKCVAGEFILSCSVGLRKVGNVEPIYKITDDSETGINSKGSKTSTADTPNTSRAAIR